MALWFLPVIKAAIPLVKAAAPWIATYFVGQEAVKRWGSTPRNDLQKAGVSPEQQHQEWLIWRDDNKKYMEEKTDELFKDLKERNKELQENYNKLAEQLKNTSDPSEKARLMEMMGDCKKEINQNNQTMAEQVGKLKKALESFGTQSLTQQQFQAKADAPNLSSFKNWGIIAFCLVVAIMLLNFLWKWLTKLLGKKD